MDKSQNVTDPGDRQTDSTDSTDSREEEDQDQNQDQEEVLMGLP